MRKRFGAAIRTSFVAGILLAGAGLTGCSASEEDAVAARLDASVVQTAERASTGDYAGALASLDVLQAQVGEYVDAGSLSETRSTEIGVAIEAVRADLAAAQAADGGTEGTGEPTEDTGEAPAPDTSTAPVAPVAPQESVPDGVVDTEAPNTGTGDPSDQPTDESDSGTDGSNKTKGPGNNNGNDKGKKEKP